MSPKKKKSATAARKSKSPGLWIAPDLERRIKGEGGRRGLGDAPYSYYLHLADVALRPSPPTSSQKPPKLSVPRPPKVNAPKPPKLAAPKPPKNPKPPKLALPKPPKRKG